MDVIKKIKNYTINERHCLGEGSFGKVYEATSDEGRKVAIKRVEQKLICSDRYLKESLENEIAIMQKLRHPNIVELYEVIYTQNNIYLIMEYCSGGDLKRYCTTRRPSEDSAFIIIRQIAKGFEELSKFGIIHRDLKAANVLVHGQVFKICDFGFAKFFGEGGRMARTCVGTPIYMSPQVLKHRQYTSKTDVWSLGVLFFELAFGRLPYTGYSEDDLYRNIAKGPLQIPECSKEATRLLQGCLAIEEEDRWGWAEVLQVLFGKYNGQKARGSTPKHGIFYKDEPVAPNVNLTPNVKPEVMARIAANNYVEEGGYEQPQSDRMKSQPFKKQARNILAVQAEQEQQRQPLVTLPEPEQNPRFLYFVFVEMLVNPIDPSNSFDQFLFCLWKAAVEHYEKAKQKNDINPLYKLVIGLELEQLRKLEGQLKSRKQGNFRKLGEQVMQEGKIAASNRKKLLWLKRLLDKKYSFDPID